MDNHLREKIDKCILFFMVYAMIGWIYEVFLEVVVYRWGFSNRGVLTGPWLPVYGVGAITFYLLWYRLIKDRPAGERLIRIPLIFLLTMLTATLIELVTSYILEWTMGSWPWQTYADYTVNYQARIALSPSLRFGLGGVIFLYLVQPFLEKLAEKLGEKRTRIAALIILIVLGVDMVFSLFLSA